MSEANIAWRTRGSKLWDRQLMDYEMEALMRSFEGTARVSCQHGMSIISLICNVARTSEILEQARPSAAPLALRSPPELCRSRSLAVPALCLFMQKMFLYLHVEIIICCSKGRCTQIHQAIRFALLSTLAQHYCAEWCAGVPRAGARGHQREDDEPGRVEDQHLPHRLRQ